LNFKLLADTDYKVSTAYDSLSSHGDVNTLPGTHLSSIRGKLVKSFTEVNPTSIATKYVGAGELQK